jgi:hypothetical protein
LKSSSRIFLAFFTGLAAILVVGLSGPRPSAADDDAAPAEPSVVIESAWLAAGATEGGAEQLFTVRFRYGGDAPANGLRIVLAVPEGLRYVAGSAIGPGAELSYSVDGGLSFAPAGELEVAVDPDDAEAGLQAAQAEDYSHIRWDLPGTFAPGVSGLVSFRASSPAAPPLADGEAAESAESIAPSIAPIEPADSAGEAP